MSKLPKTQSYWDELPPDHIDRPGKPISEELKQNLQTNPPFDLAPALLTKLIPHLRFDEFKKDEVVFHTGSMGDRVYFVLSGLFTVSVIGFPLFDYEPGKTFGEMAFVEDRKTRSRAHCSVDGILVWITNQALEKVSNDVGLKVWKYIATRLTNYMRGTDLYSNMDVLLLQDGGCSPGYNQATAFLVEYFENYGRRCFISNTGFRSLVSNRDEDYSLLINDKHIYKFMSQTPGVKFAPPLRTEPGADFRTERFPEFAEEKNQIAAADAIKSRKVKTLVCIGGNGTFAGTKALAKLLPKEIQIFFIPATVDSDVSGTETLGQHTAVEVGAEKLRGFMADARTHHRAYLIEMMGRDGGFHCLHSALGAGAHLAVLPNTQLHLPELAEIITKRETTVIAVAEGYGRKERQEKNLKMNAAEFLLQQMRETGKLDEKERRVVCEPFSRDLRGAATNNLDMVLAQKMAAKTVDLAHEGKSCVMATVVSAKVGYLSFDEIETDNSCEGSNVELADRVFKKAFLYLHKARKE